MRTTISLDDTIADLADKVAKRENRSFSNLVEVALSEYCEASNEVDAITAEATAAAESVGPAKVIAALRALKSDSYESAAETAGGAS
jgi:predicted transcriptional regulator